MIRGPHWPQSTVRDDERETVLARSQTWYPIILAHKAQTSNTASPPAFAKVDGEHSLAKRRYKRLRAHTQNITAVACAMAEKVQFGASVVAGCDASPVFDVDEHAFDTVAAFVAPLIIFDGRLG